MKKTFTNDGTQGDKMKFSDKQIEALRNEYAKIDKAGVDILPKFHALFAKMPNEPIIQLRNAQIKFVSKLANNELFRRNYQEVA